MNRLLVGRYFFRSIPASYVLVSLFVAVIWACCTTLMAATTSDVVTSLSHQKGNELSTTRTSTNALDSFRSQHRMKKQASPSPPLLLISTDIPRDQLPPRNKEGRPKPVLKDRKTNVDWMMYSDRLMVIPEYKLLFCYIDKVGCTMMNRIGRMLRFLAYSNDSKSSRSSQSSRDEMIFQAGHNWFRNNPKHHGYSLRDVETLLMDPTWTKAVMFRDPAIRFLSAYRSKCVVGEDKGTHCKRMFRLEGAADSYKKFTFDAALDMLQENPQLVIENDPHVMPATNFCGGLSNGTLSNYDFVHPLTEQTSPTLLRRLLTSILEVNSTITDQMIDCFVTSNGNCDPLRSLVQQSLPPNETIVDLFPETQNVVDAHHKTGSNRALLDSYKTDARLQVVQRAYQQDYELFQIPQRTLAETERANH